MKPGVKLNKPTEKQAKQSRVEKQPNTADRWAKYMTRNTDISLNWTHKVNNRSSVVYL